MKKLLGLVEQGFVVVSLLLSTGGPITLLKLAGAEGEGAQEGNDPFLQIIFFGIYAVSLLLIAARWKQVLPDVSKRDKLIWLLLFFIVASTLWSANPDITLRRSLALVGTTLFGVYLATRYTLKQQLNLLAKAFGVAILMSFVFSILLRKYGVMHGLHEGAWRGIYIHKNALGTVMGLSAIHFLVMLTDKDKKKWATWAGFIFSFILLLLSTSKSSLVTFFTLVVLLPLYKTLRWRYDLVIPFLISILFGTGVLGTLLVENRESILGLIGKDATLTGRTDIWRYIWDMIEKSPWLGYGYSGFWGGGDSPGAYVWYASGWKVPHSHNGILELVLALGWVGTALYALGFIVSFSRSIALIRITKTSEYLWPAMFLTWLSLSNIAEPNVLGYNSINWILYVMATLCVFNSSNSGFTTRYKVINPYKFDIKNY